MQQQQKDLFERFREPTLPRPSDRHVAQADAPRLSGQNLIILEMLRIGPVTNGQLAEVSLKYTSRLSDLRKHGYQIKAMNQGNGVWMYSLQ